MLKFTRGNIANVTDVDDIQGIQSQSCPTSSPYHKMISGSCYYLETRQMSHSSAKQNCLHQFGSSATGQLFEPRSLSINEAVYRQAQITFSTADFWLGVTDLKDQKYRYESDGTEVSMDQGPNGMWADDQPNDSSDHCVLQDDGKWWDRYCSGSERSICEMVGGSSQTGGQPGGSSQTGGAPFLCPIFNPSYRALNGSCYYFETQELDYTTAQENCRNKSGSTNARLFEPRDTFTNKMVGAIARTFATPTSINFWLGITDLNPGQTYRYASDDTVAVSGMWASNQPNGINEHCVVQNNIFLVGIWIDRPCLGMYKSICQIH